MVQSPIVFDRALLRRRRERAAVLGPASFLLERAVAELAERLSVVMRRFDLAADLGTPGDMARRRLRDVAGTLIAIDAEPRLRTDDGSLAVVGDLEFLPLRDGGLDLAVSVLALQFVNDLPGTLLQIRRALKPDGLFLAALIGGQSLTELRESFAAAEAEIEGGVSPRVAPFADVRELGGLLQRAGFALPVADVDRVVVRYASPLALMHDLRRMGATNALTERRRAPLRRATLHRMVEIYSERFADSDGRVRASFDIVWLSGWSPHESQQKPLAPGSAKLRLADALGARETSAGEKASR
jgi:SAM-dependent methyltransferase